MKVRKVGIRKARIEGLTEKNFYWSDELGFYKKDIVLKAHYLFMFKNLLDINLEKNSEKAQQYHNKIIKQFDSVGIHEGDEVVILINEQDSTAIAIGSPASNKWIDVNDYFKIKVFNDFNLFISDLTVY